MTRLRARIAERLIQSKNENAILTTFNEVNMAPVMALRKQYGDKFEKAHGVRLGFMGFFVRRRGRPEEVPDPERLRSMATTSSITATSTSALPSVRPVAWWCPSCATWINMSIADIEKKIAEFGQKAKDGKISSRSSPAAPSRSPTAACSAR